MSNQCEITVNSITYQIKATMVKRSIKNQITKIAKPLSKAKQDGTNVPETLAIDLKRITDMITINGEIHPQTIGGVYYDSITSFNRLVTAFKTRPGPYTISYRGTTYSGLFDQLESEDRADVLQAYINNSNTMISDVPQKIKVTISFTVSTVR
jgi:hypothetical protein